MVSFYYAQTLKAITIALLSKFDGMQVHRYSSDGKTIIKIINVPITFAPVEKIQQDRLENYTAEPESTGRRSYLQVPRIALTLNSITYAPERAIGVNEYRYFADSSGANGLVNALFSDFEPAPYNYTYTLFLRTDSMSDWSQMIENIIPYFNPKLYLRVKEFSFLNIERDLQVILNTVNPEFTDELDKNSQRQLNGSVVFTVEGWAYKPIATSKLVKVVNTRYYIATEEEFAENDPNC